MFLRARAAALGAATLFALGTLSAVGPPTAQAAAHDVTGTALIAQGSGAAIPADGATVTASSTASAAEVSGPVNATGGYSLSLDDATTWTICVAEDPALAVDRFLPDQCSDSTVNPSLTDVGPAILLQRAGNVSGMVTGTDITTARLLTQRHGVWAESSTDPQDIVDSTGHFEIHDVPDGTDYRLCFDAVDDHGITGPAGCDGGDFPDVADVVVVAGGTRTIGATTLTTSTVELSGTALDSSGAAVVGADAMLERQLPGQLWEKDYDNSYPGTRSGGVFSFQVLPGTYRLTIRPDGSNPTTATYVSDAPITVAANELLAPSVLPPAGTIDGTISAPTGASAEGVRVRALSGHTELASTTSDAGGAYALTNVPTGSPVTLEVAGADPTSNLQVKTISGVTAGSEENVALALGSTFAGTVVDADVPSVNAEVTAFDPDGAYPSRSAYVTTAGQFSVGGLTPGVSYDVSIDPHDGRQVRYLRNAAADVQTGSTDLHAFPAGAALGVVDLSGLNGTVPAPAAIEISGSPVVGATLHAQVTGWSPTAQPEQVLYTWYAGPNPVTPTETSIGSAVAPYTVQPADVGKPISLQVTGRLSGYRSARTQPGGGTAFAPPPPSPPPAASTPTPTPSLAVTRGPTLSGKATVGKVLSVSPGAASPSASVSVQWLRNGAPIPGATRASYKLGKADRGKRISVRASYTRSGYTAASRTTSASRRVVR